MELAIISRTMGDVSILDCSGKLVFGDNTAYLRQVVKEALKGCGQVVINLSEVNYLDSSGLGTLVGLHISARNAGGAIKLAGLNGRVQDLLSLTRVAAIFEMFDSAEDAAATFNTTAGTSSPSEWVA